MKSSSPVFTGARALECANVLARQTNSLLQPRQPIEPPTDVPQPRSSHLDRHEKPEDRSTKRRDMSIGMGEKENSIDEGAHEMAAGVEPFFDVDEISELSPIKNLHQSVQEVASPDTDPSRNCLQSLLNFRALKALPQLRSKIFDICLVESINL